MTLSPLSASLDAIKKAPIAKQVQAAKVIEVATQVITSVLPAEMSDHARPLFLKNRTLTVSCVSSAVAQEVRLHQSEIVKKINDGLGESALDRIRYLA